MKRCRDGTGEQIQLRECEIFGLCEETLYAIIAVRYEHQKTSVARQIFLRIVWFPFQAITQSTDVQRPYDRKWELDQSNHSLQPQMPSHEV